MSQPDGGLLRSFDDEGHKDEALRVMNRMAGKRDAAGRMSVAAKAEKRRTRLIQM
jgi:hypothetical protein